MNIISSFSNHVLNVFPQIFSSQMFYLDGEIKERLSFKVNNNYILNFQYLYGSGNMVISFLDYEKFYTSRNFRGKPIAIPIDKAIAPIIVIELLPLIAPAKATPITSSLKLTSTKKVFLCDSPSSLTKL